IGAAAATRPEAAIPTTWTNSRLLVSLLMIAPRTLRQTLWPTAHAYQQAASDCQPTTLCSFAPRANPSVAPPTFGPREKIDTVLRHGLKVGAKRGAALRT